MENEEIENSPSRGGRTVIRRRPLLTAARASIWPRGGNLCTDRSCSGTGSMVRAVGTVRICARVTARVDARVGAAVAGERKKVFI